jgi:hypothetical protein
MDNTFQNKHSLFLVILIFFNPINIFPQFSDQAVESIKSENLLKTVKKLCSYEFDGRLPGSNGYNKAAMFAADKFKQVGLVPAGDEEYFQYLNVEYNKIDTPIVFKMITNEKSITYFHGEDFVLRGFTGAGELISQVVFCGYGISRPDLGYDDYEKIDVRDKIVLVFKQNPTWKINDQPWGNENTREKSNIAIILFVSIFIFSTKNFEP